jgi:CSLREA domain-containing protein
VVALYNSVGLTSPAPLLILKEARDMLRTPPSRLLMWGDRTTVLVVGLAVIGVLVLMVGLVAQRAHAAPSSFTVNSTADPGTGGCNATQCTLREAILAANSNNNPTETDRINFNISGTALNKTIAPTSALPQIVEPVIIDGYSQPNSAPNTLTQGTNALLRIQIDGTNVVGSGNGLHVNASNTVVKGLVINRFSGGSGIFIDRPFQGDLVTNVRIEGNFIGTNRAGTSALGNSGGVILVATTNSTVGGTSLASRNLISGNQRSGVSIAGSGGNIAEDNKLQGNLIGTQKDGSSALGNAFDGVVVFNDAVGNRILSNSIFSNGDEGIDLGANGPTPNDLGDTDTGGNRLQNFPVISSAKSISGTTTIEGTLNSRPKELYTIEFFSNPPGTEFEGRTVIGQKVVSTNINGNVSFSFSRSPAVAVGRQITATATRNATGDTSGYSAGQQVTAS